MKTRQKVRSKKDKKVILKVDLPADLIKQIKALAKKEGKTFNELVNAALEYELNKLDAQLDTKEQTK